MAVVIYLAQPYSSLDPHIRHLRYLSAMKVSAALFLLGRSPVYSPILHWHKAAAVHQLPSDAETWWNQNRAMLDLCSEFYLLQIPGWQGSAGLRQEATYAFGMGVPPVVTAVTLRYHSDEIAGLATSLPSLHFQSCEANILTQFVGASVNAAINEPPSVVAGLPKAPSAT